MGVWKEVNQHSSDLHLAITGIITPTPRGYEESAGFWLNAENKIIGLYSYLLKRIAGPGKPNFHLTCAIERASDRMIHFANYGRIHYKSHRWSVKIPLMEQRLFDLCSSDEKIPAVHKIQKWWLKVKYNPHTYAGKKCFYQGGISKGLWSKEQVPIKYWSKAQLDEVNYTWG